MSVLQETESGEHYNKEDTCIDKERFAEDDTDLPPVK